MSTQPQKPVNMEKAISDLSPKEYKDFLRGRIRMVYDKINSVWKIMKTREFKEARGPMTAIGVGLLVIVASIMFIGITGIGGIGADEGSDIYVGSNPLHHYNLKITNTHAAIKLNLTERVNIDGSITATADNISTITPLKILNATEAEIIIPGMSKFAFKEVRIIVDLEFTRLENNSTPFNPHASITFIKPFNFDEEGFLVVTMLVALAWFSGAFIWTGVKGRDPKQVQAGKLKT